MTGDTRPEVVVEIWYDTGISVESVEVYMKKKGEKMPEEIKEVLKRHGFIYRITTERWVKPYPEIDTINNIIEELRKYAQVTVERIST